MRQGWFCGPSLDRDRFSHGVNEIEAEALLRLILWHWLSTRELASYIYARASQRVLRYTIALMRSALSCPTTQDKRPHNGSRCRAERCRVGTAGFEPATPEPHWPFRGSQSRQLDGFSWGNRASAPVSERQNTEEKRGKRTIERVKHVCDCRRRTLQSVPTRGLGCDL